jgi:hypothetical protein
MGVRGFRCPSDGGNGNLKRMLGTFSEKLAGEWTLRKRRKNTRGLFL